MTSLGNIEATPLASLTFIDFLTGAILYITGTAKNFFGPAAQEIMPFQNALTIVHVSAYTLVHDAFPLRQRVGTSAHPRYLILSHIRLQLFILYLMKPIQPSQPLSCGGIHSIPTFRNHRKSHSATDEYKNAQLNHRHLHLGDIEGSSYSTWASRDIGHVVVCRETTVSAHGA